jgi:hypothetical protein
VAREASVRISAWLDRARTLPAWVPALAAFAASFLVLRLDFGPAPLSEDTARDVAIARDCADAGICAMAGPPASFGNLTQGALWIHALEASFASGIGLRGAQTFAFALCAAAGVLVAFVPRRIFGSGAGPAAWALFLAATAWSLELPLLWNPILLPLPLAVFHVALLGLATTRGTLPAAAAGAALALATDAHVACVGMLPFLVGAVLALASRPVLASLGAVGALAATSVASSPDAIVRDAPRIASAWVPAAAVTIVAVVVGCLIRRRAQAADPRVRARAVLVAVSLYFTVGVVAASLATGHVLAPRYVAPVVPALALLIATVAVGRATRSPSWRAAAGNAAALLLLGLAALEARPPSRTGWTVLDCEPLARSLASRGWSFGDLYGHLRGPEAQRLLAALGPYLPPPDGGPHRPVEDDLLLLKVPQAAVQRLHAERLILAPLPDGMAAVGRAAPSWLDVRSIDVCAQPPGADARCTHTGLGEHDPDEGARGTLAQRAYPEIESVHATFFGEGARPVGAARWTIAVRLRASAAGPAHVIRVARSRTSWRIERVEGAHVRGALPALETTIEAVTDEARIVFAVDSTAEDAGSFGAWLPGLVETDADEEALRALSDSTERGSP